MNSRVHSRPFLVVVSAATLVVGLSASKSWAQTEKPSQTGSPYLGIVIAPAEHGIAVREITPDSPAAKAGFKLGDQITKVDDKEVKEPDDFMKMVGGKNPGDQLTLNVLRDGREQTLNVTLGRRPAAPQPFPQSPRGLENARRPAFLGIMTEPLTDDQRRRLDSAAQAGVVVQSVLPNSPAAQAGVKTDDVITAIDKTPITDPAKLRDLIQETGPGKQITIHALRGKEEQTLTAKLGEASPSFFLSPGNQRFPNFDAESRFDPMRRIQQLERRLEELERRVRDLEKK